MRPFSRWGLWATGTSSSARVSCPKTRTDPKPEGRTARGPFSGSSTRNTRQVALIGNHPPLSPRGRGRRTPVRPLLVVDILIKLSRSAPSSRTRPQISAEDIQAPLNPKIRLDIAHILTLTVNPVIPITTALTNCPICHPPGAHGSGKRYTTYGMLEQP